MYTGLDRTCGRVTDSKGPSQGSQPPLLLPSFPIFSVLRGHEPRREPVTDPPEETEGGECVRCLKDERCKGVRKTVLHTVRRTCKLASISDGGESLRNRNSTGFVFLLPPYCVALISEG